MKPLFAGWLAIAFALGWNRLLLHFGVGLRIRLGLLVPLGEELIKYFASYIFKSGPIPVYIIFGLGEGLYEVLRIRKKIDLALILAGVMTHSVLSLFFLPKIPVWLSLTFAISTHIVWNNLLLNQKNNCNHGSA